MSVRVYKDVEEALAREVRRITFHENRNVDEVVLQETFDVFTGETIKTHIDPDFYDSSADTSHRQYPHFFIKLIRTREDRFSNREVSYYGNLIDCPAEDTKKPITNDRAYQQVVPLIIGDINSVGNDFLVTNFQIRKIKAGHLLRIVDGNNQGTYQIDSVTISSSGTHTITVNNTLLEDLPEFFFDAASRKLTFIDSVEIQTVEVGNTFTDSNNNQFTIDAIDGLTITLGGSTTPTNGSGGSISQSGNMFDVVDSEKVCALILDPDKPILNSKGNHKASGGNKNVNPDIPLDAYYLIRIDSTEKDTHTEILNRMWEEFNPPRSALSTIVRTSDSAEEFLTDDVALGGSTSLKVKNADFKVNDKIFVIDDFNPTKNALGSFAEPFEATIVGLSGDDTIILDKTVPDNFTTDSCAKVVSNAEHELYMFHFTDHITKDVEGAQYWVHEFTFWVQLWVSRLGEPIERDSAITNVSTPIEDTEANIIIDD